METIAPHTARGIKRTVVEEGKLIIRFADATPAVRVPVADLALTAPAIRTIGRVMARLALTNPTGGDWVQTLDRHLGRTVGLEPEAALAERLWRVFGGAPGACRSDRMRAVA